jgi:outer membrane protein assembly factor BamD
MKFLRFVAILSVLFQLTVACTTGEKLDTSTPEGAFKQAEEFEKDERFEEAVAKYSDLKNKFPYSKFATAAELKIADVHFKREAFIEAQGAYQLFKEFHPKHPQIDYVTFRLGMSYFNQLPSSIDRDLTVADKAILYFDEVLNSYGNSQYAAEAKTHRTEALTMQAKKELYVADFYVKKERFDSALKRYETVIKKYPGLGLDAYALYGAARSALKTGEKERGQRYLETLYSQYPNSDEAGRAKHELK